jgi:hypothetical protein
MSRKDYYMSLLESRAKRLNELLEVAAPTDLICKEVRLLTEAALPLSPSLFESLSVNNSENDFHKIHSATG